MDMSTSILSLCVLKYKFIVDPGYKLKRMLLQDGYNWWGTLGILILVLSKTCCMTLGKLIYVCVFFIEKITVLPKHFDKPVLTVQCNI